MSLAIVIPAYKSDFLERTLSSFKRQTNKNFKIYIGDDCSPNDIKQICDKFTASLDLVYHRFSSNLGLTDLVNHWERCVDRIENEEWIWLFSDDDTADERCVETFYNVLKDTNSLHDVYRFNTRIIDGFDQVVAEAEASPTIEDSMGLAYNILWNNRGNSMPDHIFKRTKYIELNGFVNFIQAQASDWASSINYAYDNKLYTIAGPKVSWRNSGLNISSVAYKNRSRLILGHLQFIKWVNEKFTPADEEKYHISLDSIRQASAFNLSYILEVHYHGIPLKLFSKIVSFAIKVFRLSRFKALVYCLKINIKVYRKGLRQK